MTHHRIERRPRRAVGLALAAWCALGLAARAEDVTDPAPGHPGVTYQQLLRQAMPKLAKGDGDTWNAGAIPGLRDASGKAETLSDLSFDSLDVQTAQEGGHRRLLVLTDGNQSDEGFAAVLMVFDDEPATPKLLDKMDVGQDQMVILGDPFPIAAGSDAFLIDNTHTDSGESYDLTSPFYLQDGKLHIVTTLFTSNVQECGYQGAQDIKVGVAPAPGARFNSLTVRISDVMKRTDEDCDPAPKVAVRDRVYTDTYRWSEAKQAFVAVSGAVERISDATFKRATSE